MLFFYGLRLVLAGGKAGVWMFAVAALGFYSLPSFLYFYVPAAFCWFLYSIKEKRGFRVFIKHQTAAFFLTLLLYAPIFLTGGLDAVAFLGSSIVCQS